MMEYQLDIPVGKANFHVEFKGGFENEYGIHPATFMTTDPITQHILEHSSYFACGRIVLLDTKDLGMSKEEVAMAKRKADEKAKRIQEQKKEELVKSEVNEHSDNEDIPSAEEEIPDSHSEEGSGGVAESPVEESTDLSTDETSDKNLTVVKVSNNQDAKDYLEENFGPQTNIRTWDSILACGKANGVLFVKE